MSLTSSCAAGRGLPGRVHSWHQSRSGSVLESGQDRVPSQHVPHCWRDQSCSHEGKGQHISSLYLTVWSLSSNEHKVLSSIPVVWWPRCHCSTSSLSFYCNKWTKSTHKMSKKEIFLHLFFLLNRKIQPHTIWFKVTLTVVTVPV